MKRSFLLFTATAGLAYLTLTSNKTGPASAGTGDVTGSPLSFNGNTTCASCHSGGLGSTTADIKIYDQLNNEITDNRYFPGGNYKIRIEGSNTSNLSAFGFQFVALTGSNTQAGTYTSVNSPAKQSPMGGITYIEHASPIPIASGLYTVEFEWQAPMTGNVDMYACLNAVNSNDDFSGDRPSPSVKKTLTPIPASVPSLSENIKITAYPNPAVNDVHLKITDAEPGLYFVKVLDLSGKTIHTESLNVKSGAAQLQLQTTNWASGLHFAQIVKDGAQRMIPIIKK